MVSFPGSAGTLSGNLQIPDNPRGGVVLSHCFTCSKSLKITRALATGIEDGGFAVLRFDFTGLGESEGDFSETNVTTNVRDIEAAADYMERRGFGPCVMVGHSLGGAATLLAAGRSAAVKAAVAVAAPSSPDHVSHLFTERDIERAFRDGAARVKLAGREFLISQEFFEDLERHRGLEIIGALGKPLLVVHGTADTIVRIEEGENIFAAARQPKWFAAIPGAEHFFLKPEHHEQAARAIRAFLDTVLGHRETSGEPSDGEDNG